MIFCTVGQGVAQTFPRQDIRFSSGWKYHLGDVTGAQVPSYSDAGWTPVNLPHYGDGVVAMGKGPTIGYTWYRKTFTVGSSLAGQKIFLEIDAAMQLAYVWVNDTFMRNGAPYTTRIPVAGLGPTPDTCTHRGGYVPFTMDITNYVHQGAGNVIAVRLNSAACGDNSFPPANAAPDFQYWGGLYRDVYLHAMDSLHITDPLYEAIPGSGGVFVSYPTPIVAGAASATVRVQTHVRNEHNSGIPCVLTTDIMTPDTQTVVATISTTQSIPADSTFTFTQTLAVTNPKLWHPLHPNLYIVRSRVYNNTTPADLEYTTIGIRTIRMLPSPGEAAGGLFINGQNFYANGADRHQDAPYIGNATPASGQYRDALLLKQAGFNFVRTCHYVQSPFFIRACDKLGVCVMSCLPGWQHTSTVAGFVNNSYNDIRDMIRLYRNDPAVIMWEIAHNESGDAQSYTITANADANQEYPFDTIYTGGEIGNATCAASNVGYGYKIIYSSDQHGALGCPTTMTKPMNITEYADWNFSSGGQRSARSPEMNTVRLCNNQITNESLNRSVTPASGDADIPFVGDEVWTAFDYNLVGIVRSGVVDWARIPKMGWYAYKSQMDTGTVIGGIGGAVQGPMVYIANWWASAAVVGTASANNPVRVFSNCDSVAMYVSGTLVAKQGPDIVAGTGSAAGGSGVYDSIMFLHHRPFTFNLSAYTPGTGTLRADGYLGGVVRASDTVRPPVAAARLVVTIDTATLRFQADSSDIAYVHAAIVDTNGTLMPTATNAVTFTVTTGSGAILIQPVTEAGIATTMLQAGATPGLITVTATATGLKSDSATVESVAPSSNPTGIARSFRPLAATGTAAFSIHRNGSTLFLYTPLSSAGNSSGTTFSLFSAEGRLLLKRDLAGGVTAVKMSSLPHGLYLGQLANNGGKFMQKIVW
jgi:hypothetical protein